MGPREDSRKCRMCWRLDGILTNLACEEPNEEQAKGMPWVHPKAIRCRDRRPGVPRNPDRQANEPFSEKKVHQQRRSIPGLPKIANVQHDTFLIGRGCVKAKIHQRCAKHPRTS